MAPKNHPLAGTTGPPVVATFWAPGKEFAQLFEVHWEPQSDARGVFSTGPKKFQKKWLIKSTKEGKHEQLIFVGNNNILQASNNKSTVKQH